MQSTRCRIALLSKSTKASIARPIGSRRLLSTNNRFLQVSEEVQQALSENRPVVALESTIYTHGFPYPDNVALASRLESLVRLGVVYRQQLVCSMESPVLVLVRTS